MLNFFLIWSILRQGAERLAQSRGQTNLPRAIQLAMQLTF
jgi:hypothetical protein